MADEENQTPEAEAAQTEQPETSVENSAEEAENAEVVDAAPEGGAEEAAQETSQAEGGEVEKSEGVELQQDVSDSLPGQVVLQRLTELGDIELDFQAMLGSVHITMEQFLKLGRGSIVELSQHKDDLLKVEVNGAFFAKGDVTVVDETIAVIMSDVHSFDAQDDMASAMGGDEMDMAALMEGGDDPMAAAMEGGEMDMAAAMEGGDDPMAAAMAEMDGGGE